MLMIGAGERVATAQPGPAHAARYAVIDTVSIGGDQQGAGLRHGSSMPKFDS
ncbi:MAG: hypothetical protein OMOMHJEC_02869 [Xanthomonadales bacterium]|nr:hypothetical protein [Xanthomonadales bacterium]